MKRIVGLVAAAAMVAAGGVGTSGAVASAESAARVAPARAPGPDPVVWGSCAKEKPALVPAVAGSLKVAPPEEEAAPGVECATVRVPLDYHDPWGQTVKVAINRIKGSVSRDANHLGTLFVNPGGPGASGKELAQYVSAAMPPKLAARFDVIGFDPRGVGDSQPALHCVDPKQYFAAPRPDAVARNATEEAALLTRARDYASRCGDMWAWFLPHLTTENAARDIDTIRAALGEQQISYLGYSYGTYLGAAYATLFPQRLKRLVLDSTVDPTTVWYQANLEQNTAFDRRHREFLAWVARNHAVYKLGNTAKQASFAWYSMRNRLRERPAGGKVGPSELDDVFTLGGYSDLVWPQLAGAWSSYVRKGDTKGLLAAYKQHAEVDATDENGYAVYLAVECRDAAWPRDWNTWRADMSKMHRVAPFMTWPNAWYNAPCAFWSVQSGSPMRIQGTTKLPPILMLQSKRDAATPYEGARTMRKLFPTARMVTDPGGNHGISLGGNRCVDGYLTAYLTDASVPRDLTACAARPAPRAAQKMASDGQHGHERLTELLAR
ncbi:alpha/beta hydrolase [Nonomuraea sp. NBC_01738]|uniref:alpha/beta hydrolase n=1 Tax=Nonomuraea sp. NBC_01738 TaxID=2976003 RepID=UPI002E0E25DF|nr:alpha/beta hydrolase [Nonomuraea sp. NBC_01738]